MPEPLKSSVEFTLSNWKNIIKEPSASDIAINFFAGLPFLPTNDINKTFAKKLNKMVKILRKDEDIWLSFKDLPQEEWRDIIGYEKLYKVSNYGRVKSFYFKGGRILRYTERKGKYIMVTLTKNKKSENRLLHVIVAQTFISNPQNLPVVHHKNDDKANDCIWNLVWVTRSKNTKLAYQSGAMKRRYSNENFNARLTAEQVRYIRKNYIPRHTEFGAVALAKKFQKTPSAIFDIIRFRTYKNV